MTICTMASYAYNGISGTIKTALFPDDDASKEREMLRIAAILKIALVASTIICSVIYMTTIVPNYLKIISLPMDLLFLHETWRFTDNLKAIAALGVEKLKQSPTNEIQDIYLKNMWIKPLVIKILI